MLPLTPKRIFECIALTFAAIAITFLILLSLAVGLKAKEWGQEQGKYLAPDLQEYYSTLKQPDNTTASCCGDADAYYADKVDTDPDGTLVAIITDTRDDLLVRPDGSKVRRPHIEVGTRVRVPPEKLRKHPIPNPTDHTLIFMSSGGYVYCYEPTGGI